MCCGLEEVHGAYSVRSVKRSSFSSFILSCGSFRGWNMLKGLSINGPNRGRGREQREVYSG